MTIPVRDSLNYSRNRNKVKTENNQTLNQRFSVITMNLRIITSFIPCEIKPIEEWQYSADGFCNLLLNFRNYQTF